MTLDTDTWVREALDEATTDLRVRPTLLDDVRRGGHRRLVRRRRTRLVAAAVAVVLTVTGAVTFRNLGGDRVHPDRNAASLLNQPTRGDLADDRGYLQEVEDAWRYWTENTAPVEPDDNRVADRLRGEPRVILAVRATDDRRVAVVIQRVVPIAPKNGAPAFDLVREDAVLGYILFQSPGDETPVVVYRYVDASDRSYLAAFLITPDFLVTTDVMGPLAVSTTLDYLPDGNLKRGYTRMPFRNGASTMRVPDQAMFHTLVVARTPGGDADLNDVSKVVPVDPMYGDGDGAGDDARLAAQAPRVLPWGGAPMPVNSGGAWAAYRDKPAQLLDQLEQHGRTALRPYLDTMCEHFLDTLGDNPSTSWDDRWYLYGGTRDGRNLSVRLIQYDADPGRIFAVLSGPDLTNGTVVFGGYLDRTAALPVHVELPDSQGWAVAAKGARLGYRVGDGGSWQDAGRDAALVPAEATAVRVSQPGRAAVTVPLG